LRHVRYDRGTCLAYRNAKRPSDVCSASPRDGLNHSGSACVCQVMDTACR
jgi:hypothetical protein